MKLSDDALWGVQFGDKAGTAICNGLGVLACNGAALAIRPWERTPWHHLGKQYAGLGGKGCGPCSAHVDAQGRGAAAGEPL